MKNNKESTSLNTNKEQLIQRLKNQGYLKSNKIEEALRTISREDFLPDNLRNSAYLDQPLSIGNGQTISAPHMVAIMCEALDLQLGQKVLEIGAGSGYHAAIVATIVGKQSTVFSIERFPDLAKQAQKNLETAMISNVKIEVGDGSEGLEQYAPFDRIYVTCASPQVPQPLLDQLQDPGKLLIPIGGMYCELQLIEKKRNTFNTHHLGGCAFVPLIGKFGHQ